MPARHTLWWRSSAVALIALGFVGSVHDSTGAALGNYSDRMTRATVTIRTASPVHIDAVGDSVWKPGSGSGFLVSKNGCEVWTNQHVVEDAVIIEALAADQAEGIPATLVMSDPEADLAIISLQRCDNLEAVRLGDSDRVTPGDEAFVVGNPLGLNPGSVTRGIISHTNRYLGSATPYIQTDAAMSFGSSGGALFNRAGEVIGINSRIASFDGQGSVGIGYALPINLARQVASRLRAGLDSRSAAILKQGLAALPAAQARVFGVPDGYAGLVLLDEPEVRFLGGELLRNDVLFEIDGMPVVTPEFGMQALSPLERGEAVQVRLVRQGRILEQRVALQTDAGGLESTFDDPRPDPFDGYLGMSLDMWSSADHGLEHEFRHPVITHVQSLGPAHQAFIMSSQQSMGFDGTAMLRYQIDVKTVTGAVLAGRYHEPGSVEALQSLAERAWRLGEPLVLRIETWGRDDPTDTDAPVQRQLVQFHTVLPRPAREPLAHGDDAGAVLARVDANR
ncbi:MAG: trypsin-like peptidase domain-containing protein [Gammaproteobacteria bacterium]|nr:trypsin-like peptidase domain-containing protein [Gammaproteobacteria bacterium]